MVAEEEEGRRPRAVGLAGEAPRSWEAAAAAGSPSSGLSTPLFVSAPGEGRVMSLLLRAGKQRRDKVTYPAPCPRPASPRSGGLRPGRAAGLGRAADAQRLREARPGTARRSPRGQGLRRWLDMRLHGEQAATRARISVFHTPSPPQHTHSGARPLPSLQPLPQARERGARGTHLRPRRAVGRKRHRHQAGAGHQGRD
jgi:hypothetical protein